MHDNEDTKHAAVPEQAVSGETASEGTKPAVGSQPAEKRIPVMEMFGPTIQGEGLVLGMQTHFIRLGLCDYKCVMCDSLHAVLPELVRMNAQWKTQEEIFEAYQQLQGAEWCEMVTLSGGNPAIHDLGRLVALLQGAHKKVAVETQASYWAGWIPNCDYITLSPKAPGMGERFDGQYYQDYIESIQHASHKMRGTPHPGLSIKVPIFNAGIDMEFLKYVLQLTPENIPFYASLGNPFPPKETASSEFGTKVPFPQDAEGKPDVTAWKMGLLQQYSNLAEELAQTPSFARVRFTPQWHVLVWGNDRGR